jgi:hypothetical protein
VELLKVKVLSSSPSPAKTTTKKDGEELVRPNCKGPLFKICAEICGFCGTSEIGLNEF